MQLLVNLFINIFCNFSCNFKIKKFVEQNQLKLVGANFLKGKKDVHYLKTMLIDLMKFPESMACLTMFPDTPYVGRYACCIPKQLNILPVMCDKTRCSTKIIKDALLYM